MILIGVVIVVVLVLVLVVIVLVLVVVVVDGLDGDFRLFLNGIHDAFIILIETIDEVAKEVMMMR